MKPNLPNLAYTYNKETILQNRDNFQMPDSRQEQYDPNNEKAKTSLCKNYRANEKCHYGNKCQFAHGVD